MVADQLLNMGGVEMRGMLAAVSLALLVAGCASTQRTLLPALDVVDLPPLDTEQVAEIGDTLVAKGKIYTYDGLNLRNEAVGGGALLLKFQVPPGPLPAKKEDEDWTYYYGDGVTATDTSINSQRTVPGGLKIARRSFISGEDDFVKGDVRIFSDSPVITLRPLSPLDIEHTRVSAVEKPSFKQELIYSGRSGDEVRFLYRELSGSVMRAPFSQQVQYDLSQDSVIGFKGVRIEVLEATNTQIRYRVLSSFPDPG